MWTITHVMNKIKFVIENDSDIDSLHFFEAPGEASSFLEKYPALTVHKCSLFWVGGVQGEGVAFWLIKIKNPNLDSCPLIQLNTDTQHRVCQL
jgi:hypothetical protein